MSMHLLYKSKQVFFIYYAANRYSFEIVDFRTYFDFINHFDLKSFWLDSNLKVQILIKN